MRKSLRIILGVVLIILGVAALLTPFTPGSWVALIGLEYLGLRVLLQRKLLSLLPAKYRDKVKKLFKRRKKNNRRRFGDG
jgi:membrane protein implicated in regulation of membrane protease activity